MSLEDKPRAFGQRVEGFSSAKPEHLIDGMDFIENEVSKTEEKPDRISKVDGTNPKYDNEQIEGEDKSVRIKGTRQDLTRESIGGRYTNIEAHKYKKDCEEMLIEKEKTDQELVDLAIKYKQLDTQNLDKLEQIGKLQLEIRASKRELQKSTEGFSKVYKDSVNLILMLCKCLQNTISNLKIDHQIILEEYVKDEENEAIIEKLDFIDQERREIYQMLEGHKKKPGFHLENKEDKNKLKGAIQDLKELISQSEKFKEYINKKERLVKQDDVRENKSSKMVEASTETIGLCGDSREPINSFKPIQDTPPKHDQSQTKRHITNPRMETHLQFASILREISSALQVSKSCVQEFRDILMDSEFYKNHLTSNQDITSKLEYSSSVVGQIDKLNTTNLDKEDSLEFSFNFCSKTSIGLDERIIRLFTELGETESKNPQAFLDILRKLIRDKSVMEICSKMTNNIYASACSLRMSGVSYLTSKNIQIVSGDFQNYSNDIPNDITNNLENSIILNHLKEAQKCKSQSFFGQITELLHMIKKSYDIHPEEIEPILTRIFKDKNYQWMVGMDKKISGAISDFECQTEFYPSNGTLKPLSLDEKDMIECVSKENLINQGGLGFEGSRDEILLIENMRERKWVEKSERTVDNSKLENRSRKDTVEKSVEKEFNDQKDTDVDCFNRTDFSLWNGLNTEEKSNRRRLDQVRSNLFEERFRKMDNIEKENFSPGKQNRISSYPDMKSSNKKKKLEGELNPILEDCITDKQLNEEVVSNSINFTKKNRMFYQNKTASADQIDSGLDIQNKVINESEAKENLHFSSNQSIMQNDEIIFQINSSAQKKHQRQKSLSKQTGEYNSDQKVLLETPQKIQETSEVKLKSSEIKLERKISEIYEMIQDMKMIISREVMQNDRSEDRVLSKVDNQIQFIKSNQVHQTNSGLSIHSSAKKREDGMKRFDRKIGEIEIKFRRLKGFLLAASEGDECPSGIKTTERIRHIKSLESISSLKDKVEATLKKVTSSYITVISTFLNSMGHIISNLSLKTPWCESLLSKQKSSNLEMIISKSKTILTNISDSHFCMINRLKISYNLNPSQGVPLDLINDIVVREKEIMRDIMNIVHQIFPSVYPAPLHISQMIPN